MPYRKTGCNIPDTADKELVKKVLEERNLHLLSEIDSDNSETKNVFAKMKRLRNLIIEFNREINGKKSDEEMRKLFELAEKSKHTIDHQALDDFARYFPSGVCMKRSYVEDFMKGCKKVFRHEENMLYRKIVSNKNYRERTLMKIYYFAKHFFSEIIRKLRTSDDVQVGGVQSVDEQYMEIHSAILHIKKKFIVASIRFIIDMLSSIIFDDIFSIFFSGFLVIICCIYAIGFALLFIAILLPFAIAYDVFHIPIYIHNMVVYLRKWNANRREMNRLRNLPPVSDLPPVLAEIHLPEHTVINPVEREDVHATISDAYYDAFHKLKKHAYTLENRIYTKATDEQINQFLQTKYPALFKKQYSSENKYDRLIPNAINAKPSRDSETSENVGAISAAPLEYTYVPINSNNWHMPVHTTMLSYSTDEMPEAIVTLFENSFVMKNGHVNPADDTDIQHFVSNKNKLYTKLNGKIYPLPYEVIEYHKYFAKHDNEYSRATNNDIAHFIHGEGQLYKRTNDDTKTYYPIHNPFSKKPSSMIKRNVTIKKRLSPIKETSSPSPNPSPSPKPFWKRWTKRWTSKVAPEGAHSNFRWGPTEGTQRIPFWPKKGSVFPLGGKRTIRRKRRV